MFSRRGFLSKVSALAALTPLQALYQRQALGQTVQSNKYGALQPDPEGLLDLPRGFRYRRFSETGDLMSDGNPVPTAHDGMAAFQGPKDSIILVRNHELSPPLPGILAPADKAYDPLAPGGTTTLIVSGERELIRDYTSLAGTIRNCGGGPTPWGSWLSCEEDVSTPESTRFVSKRHGYVFEVPARLQGLANPLPLTAMGRFNHEACAVDPSTGIVYLTEDDGESLFYRFIPRIPGVLRAGGTLEALRIIAMPQAITKTDFPVGVSMAVDWVRIEEVDPAEDTVRVEGFAKGAAQFARGEGISYRDGEFFFCATSGGSAGIGQIWRYLPGTTAAQGGTIELFVEPNDVTVLEKPDNITIAPFGDLILCEDGDGDNFLVGVTPEGTLYPFARNALNDSEFAGATFSPDGRTLFVNIQVPGITLAIWGPW